MNGSMLLGLHRIRLTMAGIILRMSSEKKELQVSIDTKNSGLDIAFYLGYVARCLNAVTSSAVHVISRVLYTDGLQLS